MKKLYSLLFVLFAGFSLSSLRADQTVFVDKQKEENKSVEWLINELMKKESLLQEVIEQQKNIKQNVEHQNLLKNALCLGLGTVVGVALYYLFIGKNTCPCLDNEELLRSSLENILRDDKASYSHIKALLSFIK
jgi:hypothetical protein